MSSKVGRKHFGTAPLTLVGREAWDRQDATLSWSDEGEVRAVLEKSIKELEAVVARNAALAVGEYAASGEAAVTISNQNEILVGVRLSNDEATLIAYVPLRALLISALQSARQSAGVDPNAQALVSNLIHLGVQLSKLGQSSQPTQGSPTP